MEISFDPAKRETTPRERGLDFADAAGLFATPSYTIEDDRFAYPEPRFLTYGMLGDRLAMVAWTPTDTGVRIMSMGSAMNESAKDLPPEWDDPDLPEWPEEVWDRAEITIGGKTVRAAAGTLTRAGRPPAGNAPKRQVTLRLDPDVIDRFRKDGPGWQSRINAALRKAAGLG